MSLLVDISRIRNNKGVEEPFVLSAEVFDFLTHDWQLASKLTVQGTTTNEGTYLSLVGSYATEVKSRCSRCLTVVTCPLAGAFAERLLYKEHLGEVESGARDELEELYDFYTGDVFDLTHLLREAMLGELPYKVLCDDHCQGLCPKCGINLNQDTCRCDLEELDPRLAILAQLKVNEEV